MTDAQLLQMYDDFYQADSGSSRFAGGLGLGIPIARGLLHAMGGFVHFDSEGQKGLQAHITIPQGVADDSPSIALSHERKLCIACYFRPEKYSCDEVRGYYDRLILHLVEGLDIEGYQAHNFEGLLKLQRSHDLTHVFIAQDEYEKNSSYYEEIEKTIQVVVIAERDFVLDRNSRLLVIHKPFFALSVVNLLNGEVKENGFEEAQAAGRRPFSCAGVKVLVVDDEEMNLVVAKGVLGSYGIQVDTCLSGREAVERCNSVSYDMIFLDHMMPGFDGVQTLRLIREMNNGMYQDLPVIALTANTISGAREMFRNEGFTEFVPKPIERAVLERVLRRVLPKNCIQYGVASAPAGKAEGNKGSERVTEAEENKDFEYIAETEGDKSSEYAEDTEEFKEPAGREEASGSTEEASRPFDVLAQVGIDVQMGLDYCGGDEEFYLEMLQMFCAQSGEKKVEIVSLYEAANWKDYAIKVHALKSTALTIGAEQLSAHAKALEMAGKNGDEEFILKNHAELLDRYQEVCESIAQL